MLEFSMIFCVALAPIIEKHGGMSLNPLSISEGKIIFFFRVLGRARYSHQNTAFAFSIAHRIDVLSIYSFSFH